ncbi:MAG: CopD family protein [Candidatus Nitrosopelagicus sp.]|jgi:putative copper export protein|nr:CopD family protein [Candidatus Nitrosopelagicus sp.]|tara:strand:- start:397 stop:891 length:495 start_codon:yes stop_codon:yes gene_type:complete
MAIEQAIVTWIHLISASIWVGGSIFLGVVLAPLLKKMSLSIEERLELMIKVGRRFNKIALPSLVILIGTGIYNSHLVLQSPEILFSSSYGAFLITKIVLVIALIVTFAVHIRLFSKDIEQKISARQIADTELKKLNKKGMILGETTVVISVAILFFAALMDAGI